MLPFPLAVPPVAGAQTGVADFSQVSTWRRTAGMVLIAILIVGGGTSKAADADVASDVTVKAALLYNFVKFAEWPMLTPSAPILMCIVGDDGIAGALREIVQGQNIGGHRLDVRAATDTPSWRGCHLLFVADAEMKRSADGLGEVRTQQVLTVSDGRSFSHGAGIIELYVQDKRMRFAINVDAAERARLRLSSRLLALAKIIRDGAAQ